MLRSAPQIRGLAGYFGELVISVNEVNPDLGMVLLAGTGKSPRKPRPGQLTARRCNGTCGSLNTFTDISLSMGIAGHTVML